ncbi:hypothetical protein CCP3SC1AL1_2490004 [Gammaproteobacteria bacterium]
MTAIETYLRLCPGVSDVHDLHVWGMSTTENTLTAHLVIPGNIRATISRTTSCRH